MSAEKIIRTQEDGALAFGNHNLKDKTKADNFSHKGDTYKVKTFDTMTKLEKNEMFLYESVPGTTVTDFVEDAGGVSFKVKGAGDVQIILGLADQSAYKVSVDGEDMGELKTNLGGKLNVSAQLVEGREALIKVTAV